jgi:radical SAM protein with 4Fe4S-binding SPASM domain
MKIQDFSLWKKMVSKRIPSKITFDLTARCNNQCRHCYINLPASDQKAKNQELSLGEIDAIAAQAVELGAVWCSLTGGEPLLRPDFPEIYLALKKKGLLITLFTNATLINQEHIDLFKRYPPRDIEVTVYGVTQETYETVTQVPGSFLRFMKGLNLLHDSGIPAVLKTMAILSNYHELEAIIAFGRKFSKTPFRFDTQLHMRYDRDVMRNQEIQSERLSPQQIITLENSQPEYLRVLKKSCDMLIYNKGKGSPQRDLFACGAGRSSIYISYDGIFRLCSGLWAEGTTYDLRKGSLRDAWTNFAPGARNLQAQTKAFKETCGQCPLINICTWCPAHADLETGNLEGPVPYFCKVAHLRAENILSEE